MKINEISSLAASLPGVEAPKMSDKELKKAATDFAAIFYEKVLAGMLKATGEQKEMPEEMWWEMLTQEVAREIAASSPALAEQFYTHLKK